jgi:hypothetical protein
MSLKTIIGGRDQRKGFEPQIQNPIQKIMEEEISSMQTLLLLSQSQQFN